VPCQVGQAVGVGIDAGALQQGAQGRVDVREPAVGLGQRDADRDVPEERAEALVAVRHHRHEHGRDQRRGGRSALPRDDEPGPGRVHAVTSTSHCTFSD
jgi:hypothetical protein